MLPEIAPIAKRGLPDSSAVMKNIASGARHQTKRKKSEKTSVQPSNDESSDDGRIILFPKDLQFS